MKYKKPKGILKLFLKLTNNKEYERLKLEYKAYKNNLDHKKNLAERKEYFLREMEKLNDRINFTHTFKNETYFKHSGNSGDIIYSLPALFSLTKKGKAILLLRLNQKGDYGDFHPLGDVMLNQSMYDKLKPLLTYQPNIKSCDIYINQDIDYDLDLFRECPFLLDRGSISRWYFHTFRIFADLGKPWLVAPKKNDYADFIVIARSHRYRNPSINYAFLKKYPKKVFIGVPIEYEDIKSVLPDLEYQPINDFLEMATIINSCKFFIGNQSFPFSIAEGLKVNRLLEVCFEAPNVIVEGSGGYDFLFQAHFEKLVEELYNDII